MKMIRYSRGFKMQCVKEVESGKACAYAVQRKYQIKGTGTVMRWVRQFGSGKYGKIIRVEKADEVNEVARLRNQLRQAKEALADTHMELALEKAFLAVACEEMEQSLEGFKKKHAGGRRTRRSKPTLS
jgi:transposase-like protein